MNRKPVITSLQLLLMAVGSALVFPFTFLPILNAPPANQDAWVVLLLACVYIFMINVPLLFLANKFRGVSAIQATEITMGKFFGKVVLIPFLAFFIYCYMACLLITAIFIELYIFPRTPTWALLIFMVVPVIYATWKGAGTIGRLANFLVPFAALVVVVFFILSISELDFGLLQPMLSDSTFVELNLGAFFTGARYSEILIFWVFSNYLGKKYSINKTYAATLGTFALLFMLILLPTMMILGTDYAKMAWNPYYTFTRQLKAFGFLERVQAINIIAWFPMAVLKLALYSYMACEVLSGIVKAKTHKYFVIPVSVIVFVGSLLPFMNKSSTVELLRSDAVMPFIVTPVIFVVPVIILIVYLMRRKKINQAIKQARTKTDLRNDRE